MKKLYTVIVSVGLLIFMCGSANAAITASPNPVRVGQSTNVLASIFFVDAPGICTMQINFGDGSPWTDLLPACGIVESPCSRSISHIYNTTGNKSVTVQPKPGFCAFPPPGTAPYRISVLCAVPGITTPSALPGAIAGTFYSTQLQSSGQPPFSYISAPTVPLPSWLTLSPSGLLSGTPPLTPATYSLGLYVTDSCGLSNIGPLQNFTLQVSCPAITVASPANMPAGFVGQPYSYQIQAAGGSSPLNVSLSAGALPPGLSLTPSGLISGAPTLAGTYTFSLAISDVCRTGAVPSVYNFTLTIQSCPPLSITTSSLPNGIGGQAYSRQIQTSGGQQPVSFSLAGSSLPPGLNLSSAGMISGIPTTIGNYSFIVNAIDSCRPVSQGSQRNLSIDIQSSSSSLLSVTPVPASFSVPGGRSSLVNVIHQFIGSSFYNDSVNSPSGRFIVAGEVVEVNSSPLSVNIINGRGQMSEGIGVPVRVIERALQRGARSFIYERAFSDGTSSLLSSVTFTITTDAGADFAIRRIDLHFRDYRPDATVPRNFPNLKAYADISFVGSGLLKGYWEVDGGLLSYVEQHLTFGSQITLQSPDVPQLPTFSGGTHIVRFVIKSPASTVDVPSISYFVTAQEYQDVDIRLIAPDEKPISNDGPARFEWEKAGKAVTYLIQFFRKKDDAEPFFSALTRDTKYQVPENVYREKFAAGNTYFWKVSGFDSDNNTTAESGVRRFSLK